MTLSMTGQEKDGFFLHVTSWASLTVLLYYVHMH
jgi:hypothetical protein